MNKDEYYAAIGEFKSSHQNVMIHYGVPGQKWGVRRYQNPDGSYTAAGRERYTRYITRQEGKLARTKSARRRARYQSNINKARANMVANEKANRRYATDANFRKQVNRSKAIRRIGTAAAIGAGLATAYGISRGLNRTRVPMSVSNPRLTGPTVKRLTGPTNNLPVVAKSTALGNRMGYTGSKSSWLKNINKTYLRNVGVGAAAGSAVAAGVKGGTSAAANRKKKKAYMR